MTKNVDYTNYIIKFMNDFDDYLISINPDDYDSPEDLYDVIKDIKSEVQKRLNDLRVVLGIGVV